MVTFRSKWRGRVVKTVAAVFVLLNVSAFYPARSMMVYAPAGERTAAMEDLGFWGKLGAVLFGVRIPRPALSDTPETHGWPSETQVIPTPGGGRIEGWFVPHDAPRGLVVIAPGYAASRSDFLPAVDSWRRIGFSCLVFDFRGAGGSSGTTTTAGAREAEDIRLVLDHARTRLLRPGQKVAVYGYSMGGAAALRAAAEGGFAPDALVAVAVYDRMLGTVRGRFRSMGLPASPASELLVFWGGVQQGFNGFTQNPADFARRVRVPTLVLQGGHDNRAPPADGESIHAALAGPKALHIFPEGNHVNITGGDRQAWIDAVNGILRTAGFPEP
jgi:uncharacterized protein